MNELERQKQIRLYYAQIGVMLWRNNVGSLQDKDGRWVRFGLANDSRGMNKHVKSSDLIGITPVIIGPEHLGKVIGQFTAYEVKSPNWKWKGNERELAQLEFHKLVKAYGGLGEFII